MHERCGHGDGRNPSFDEIMERVRQEREAMMKPFMEGWWRGRRGGDGCVLSCVWGAINTEREPWR